MLIPYKALYTFLEKYYTPKSLMGVIDDCYQSFDESIETAKRIEDYRYLHNMITEKETNQKKYCFFWDYKHTLPTVLLRDQDVSVDVLSKIAFDNKKSIPTKDFIALIEQIGESHQINTILPIKRFNGLLADREIKYRLMHEKIQRNEDCPCGSGKKFKYCHGKSVEAVIQQS